MHSLNVFIIILEFTSFQITCLVLETYPTSPSLQPLNLLVLLLHALSQAAVTINLMRKALLSSLLPLSRHALRSKSPALSTAFTSLQRTGLSPCRSLAQVRTDRDVFPEIWFNSTAPIHNTSEKSSVENPDALPDERTLKLGKSRF